MPDGAGFGPAVTDLLIYSTLIFHKLNSRIAEIIGVPLPYVKEGRRVVISFMSSCVKLQDRPHLCSPRILRSCECFVFYLSLLSGFRVSLPYHPPLVHNQYDTMAQVDCQLYGSSYTTNFVLRRI